MTTNETYNVKLHIMKNKFVIGRATSKLTSAFHIALAFFELAAYE